MCFVLSYWCMDAMRRWQRVSQRVHPNRSAALPIMNPHPRGYNPTYKNEDLLQTQLRLIKVTIFWLGLAAVCGYSQVFLHVFTWTQMLLGSAVGLTVGFLVSLVYHDYAEYYFEAPMMQTIIKILRLDPDRARVF